MEKTRCSSSNRRITNTLGTARFSCPKCSKHEIIRTLQMRKIAAHYKCAGCGFEGPN